LDRIELHIVQILDHVGCAGAGSRVGARARIPREEPAEQRCLYYGPADLLGFTFAGGIGEVGGLVSVIIALLLTPRETLAFSLTLLALLGLVGMQIVPHRQSRAGSPQFSCTGCRGCNSRIGGKNNERINGSSRSRYRFYRGVYGQLNVACSPVSVEELRQIEMTVGWSEEDVRILQRHGNIFKKRAEQMVDS
jgi:hypothetical protein